MFLYRFGEDFRYTANLVILYLKQIYPVVSAICSQGFVTNLLILKRPILSVEMLHILVMLFAIHFDYQIKLGQIEIGKKILTVAKHVFVG